ncbi:MAG TPA: DUF2085 domain-containing protein [Anaerolineales bacterium]|nr:DUF2085 domain-containing protein [Anaerolineales bacterium]
MTQAVLPRSAPGNLARFGRPAALLAAGVVLAAWLLATPAGLLGKADAIGYAVCHRIDVRSFHLGARTLPLCARCTGIYLGAMLAMASYQIVGRGRAGGFPKKAVVAAFILFAAIFAVDGVNSYLTLFPGLPHLYEPSNVLRLSTGLLAGVAMGTLVHAGLAQNAWKDWRPEPALRDLRELGVLLVGAAVIGGLALSGNPMILYPLALISAGGVLVVLASVYTVMALLVFGQENRATSWMNLALPAVVGLTFSILQIGGIDLVRFALTGTWSGFTF